MIKQLNNKAQTAIEYMLLLAITVTIVMVGFKVYLPTTTNAANIYYNRVSTGILGDRPKCGDGTCSLYEDNEKCCVDCGSCFVAP